MIPAVKIVYGVFYFLLGGCIGSFLNVVIWRLPNRGREILYQKSRGRMSLSWPPSHCPVCDASIQWYQNIPVLSYLSLRGRCANCRTAIPIRYPMVELAVAVLFVSVYLAYFVADWQPGITDLRVDWPPFILHLFLISALLAASAIDADLFIIPLSIPWLLAGVGIVAAGLIGLPLLEKSYSIVPDLHGNWGLAKPVAGAAIGLVVSNLLLLFKWMPQSFAWDNQPKSDASVDAKPEQQALAPLPKLTRFKPAAIAAAVLFVVAALVWFFLPPANASLVGLCAGLLIFLIGVLPRDADQVDVTDDVMEEISSPHVRVEILKEILFVGVPIVCAAIATGLPINIPQTLWMGRVLGSLLGLLAGGGAVWLIRIGGSLAFNKEAMGMGDAHLMAGVGAIIGWHLALVSIFIFAPFLAILWAIVLKIRGKPNILPFGPWLSVASILALFLGNPAVAWYMDILFGGARMPALH